MYACVKHMRVYKLFIAFALYLDKLNKIKQKKNVFTFCNNVKSLFTYEVAK